MTIIKPDPEVAEHWGYIGQLRQRMVAFYDEIGRPPSVAIDALVTHLTTLWASKSDLAGIWLLLDGGCVRGHLAATIQQHYGNFPYVFVHQCKGDVVLPRAKMAQTMADLETWARRNHAAYIEFSTHRTAAAWQRRWGFEPGATLMIKQLKGVD